MRDEPVDYQATGLRHCPKCGEESCLWPDTECINRDTAAKLEPENTDFGKPDPEIRQAGYGAAIFMWFLHHRGWEVVRKDSTGTKYEPMTDEEATGYMLDFLNRFRLIEKFRREDEE